jgi:hypothetical protein
VLSKKYLVATIILAFSIFAIASEPVQVHLHKYYVEGVLPEPYRTFSLRIELDEQNDNVVIFELFRGGELIQLSSDIISRLRDIELSTIEISHEMHRSENASAVSEWGEEGDWLHINVGAGDYYRAEEVIDGERYYHWGRDRITITVVKNRTVTFSRISLSDIARFEGKWKKWSR